MTLLLQITSGRGPEECCWIVSKLAHYLVAEATRLGFRAGISHSVPGKVERTMSSAIISVEDGPGVSDFFDSWQGTVQWVGTSMFRPHHKRKNWFVAVKLLSSVPLEAWDKSDVRIERMRSSGPGGQHANKTETAIRVTHLPTGLTAISQEERSQYLNKKQALARLENLLANRRSQDESAFDHNCWHEHNNIERGNPVHVFRGRKFILKNNT